MGKESAKHLPPHQPEYETDDYYLFYPRLALLDDFEGSTPAFSAQVRNWSDDKTEQFRKYVLDQQDKLIAQNALVSLDIPGHGPRYCFHLKTCLDRIAVRYPSILVRRIVLDPESWEYEYARM